MKFLVTDEFSGGLGWTPDNFAEALRDPLSDIGVTVERVKGHTQGGFQANLPSEIYKTKFDEVGRVVKRVLSGDPPRSR